MMPSVRMLERILPTISSSKRRAFSLGVIAATAATLDQGLADVVVETAALGVLAREQRLASVALDEPAEHVGASHPTGMDGPGCAGTHPGVHPAEQSLGNYGRERPIDSNRLSIVSGSGAPDQSPCVYLVGEDEADRVTGPELPGGAGDALVVEGADNVQNPSSGVGQLEDPLDDIGCFLIGLQLGTLLGTVLHHDPVVAVGRPAGDPEAPGGGLAHPAPDLLRQGIGYPIKTKRSDTHGPWDSEKV